MSDSQDSGDRDNTRAPLRRSRHQQHRIIERSTLPVHTAHCDDRPLSRRSRQCKPLPRSEEPDGCRLQCRLDPRQRDGPRDQAHGGAVAGSRVFFEINEVTGDGALRRLRPSEAILAEDLRPWRIAKPAFHDATGPDAATLPA